MRNENEIKKEEVDTILFWTKVYNKYENYMLYIDSMSDMLVEPMNAINI